MTRLLICDDEPGLRAVIKRYALSEGYEVVEAENGRQAVEACKKTSFDIIIMDIMMPVLDGFSAVMEIRKDSDVPIIMLSAKGEEYDKILGFELGVDDYMVKPFSCREILMRISAILKRTNKVGPDDNGHVVFSKDGFLADLTAYKVFVDGEQRELAPKIYELLFFLIRNKNIAVPRERVMDEVWGYDYFGNDRTLDTHMKLLRRAIKPYGNLIKTLRGLGFRFDG